jgi:hypothetical protein
MKIRIQRSNAGRDWHDGFDAEVTERGAQTIRVKVPGSFGYIETFWATGKRAGEQRNNSRSLRVHPDDVPALASLPVRARKTKPLDLNAHPMADVLRRVIAGMGEARDAIMGDPKAARRAIEDEVVRSDDAMNVVLIECATWALAGLAALDAQKGGT